eukprot:g55.t1
MEESNRLAVDQLRKTHRREINELRRESHTTKRHLEATVAHYEKLYLDAMEGQVALREAVAEEVERRRPLEKVADVFETVYSDMRKRDGNFRRGLQSIESEEMSHLRARAKSQNEEILKRAQAEYEIEVNALKSAHVETTRRLREKCEFEESRLARLEISRENHAEDRDAALRALRREASELRRYLHSELHTPHRHLAWNPSRGRSPRRRSTAE